MEEIFLWEFVNRVSLADVHRYQHLVVHPQLVFMFVSDSDVTMEFLDHR